LLRVCFKIPANGKNKNTFAIIAVGMFVALSNTEVFCFAMATQ
jgi:hypothetical protein